MSIEGFKPYFGKEGQLFYRIQKGTESKIGFIPALWSNDIENIKKYIGTNIDKKYKKEILEQAMEAFNMKRNGKKREIFRKGVELLLDRRITIPSSLKLETPPYITITNQFSNSIVGHAREFCWEEDILFATVEFYDSNIEESIDSGEKILTVSLHTNESLAIMNEASILGVHIISKEKDITERILTK